MRWLWRALTRNLLLKFTALVCAVVLWACVDSRLSGEHTFRAMVMYKVTHWPYEVQWPDGTAWRGRHRPVVDVTLGGRRSRLHELEPSVSVWINPAGLAEGEGSITIKNEDVIWPGAKDLRVIDVAPRELKVRISKQRPAREEVAPSR